MNIIDNQQEVFIDFSVPDSGRILKVKKWLLSEKYILPNKKCKVLEIGYARGGLLDQLSEFKEIEKYAIDVHHRNPKNDIFFYQYDCNNGLPNFDGQQFDIVFAGEVIEHIIDDKQFLKNIYSIIKPNGILCLTTPNLFFLVNRLIFPFGRMPYFAYAPYHYHIYSCKSLTEMIVECEFEVLHITSSHLLISTRRSKVFGIIFELLGNIFPEFGAHIILFARKSMGKI